MFQNCGAHIRGYSRGERMMLGFGMSLEGLYQGDKMIRAAEKTQAWENVMPSRNVT